MILKSHVPIGWQYILCKIKTPADTRDYLDHVLFDEICHRIVCVLIDHNRVSTHCVAIDRTCHPKVVFDSSNTHLEVLSQDMLDSCLSVDNVCIGIRSISRLSLRMDKSRKASKKRKALE